MLFTLEVALRPGAANEAPTEIREKDKTTKTNIQSYLVNKYYGQYAVTLENAEHSSVHKFIARLKHIWYLVV